MTRFAKARAATAVVLVVLVASVLLGCGGGSPSAPATRLVYAALGASDAVGIGAFPPSEGYVYEVADRMRTVRDAVDLHNLGISGAKVDEFVAEMLEPAIAADPEVITVWAGSNDVISGRTPDEFAEDLGTLLAALRDRTDAVVFVADLADLTRAPYFDAFPDPDVTRARVDAFNLRIHAAAAASGAVLVRLSSGLTIEPAIFSIDGFHPSNEGHRRIAELFWAEIRPRL